MSRYPGGYKHTQVNWSDLGPWVDNLYGRYGVFVRFQINLVPTKSRVSPAVTMTAWRPAGHGVEAVVKSTWRTFNPGTTGAAEAAALQMVSLLLLELEGGSSRAEQGTLL